MAINFVTGLPRAGKTLWALCAVKERADREKRQVYTCNIPGIKSGPGEPLEGWQEIEHPDLWLTLPHGSIVLVDELQDFWQKGAAGSKVPPPILELSKHGKRGIDFYIITQEPNLVHQTPRDLCAHHYYVVRAFGSHNAMVHKFERMQLHPEKQKKNSEKMPWRYNTKAFGWYKSADVHTVKREIPKKVLAIPIFAALVGLCIWGAFQLGGNFIEKAKGAKPANQATTAPGYPQNGLGGPYGGPGGPRQAEPLTPAQLMASYQPRFEGMPQTAPRYDEITKPSTAPYPAACMLMGDRCTCFTQQATRIQTPDDLCRQIVKNGFFVDWQQAQQTGQGTQQAQGVANTALTPAQAPLGPIAGNPGASPAVQIPDTLRVAAADAGNERDAGALQYMHIGKRLVSQ
jgi:zona occludens toxin